jgi:sodium transport system permease protein
MKQIILIFKKELKDTLRDRRTLMTMVVIPVLLFPIILTVFVNVSERFAENSMNKMMYIGHLTHQEENTILKSFSRLPDSLTNVQLIPVESEEILRNLVQSDSLQVGFLFSENFNRALNEEGTAHLEILVNDTKIGNKERVKMYMTPIELELKGERLETLALTQEQINPIAVTYSNTASDKETIGKIAGGILPYLFIAFGFLGCMYPSIDLFTGEKERGTIETLLTTPVERWKIMLGKMIVVVLSGLLAASLALFGLFISIEVLDLIKDPLLLEVVYSILSPQFLIMLYLLLIPMTIFFAGLMIPIVIHAKTFKEAQSIITPLNIVVIMPAMIGFFPGIELNTLTACIPIVNVVLATKELIAGTLDTGLLILSFVVMLGLAALSVLISFKQFDNETKVVM